MGDVMRYVRSKMKLDKTSSGTQIPPDFVIIGAARAGTTSLAAALERHTEVCFSRIKETNYFTPPDFGLAGPGDQQFIHTVLPIQMDGDFGRMQAGATLIRSRVLYEAMFAHRVDGQLCGEASPAYLFYHVHAARELAVANPHCKIVIILRDRVQRTLSQYKVMVTWKREFLSFKEALKAEGERKLMNWEYAWQYTDLSLYAPALASFLAAFPPEQLLILRFEDYVRHPDVALEQVATFLGITQEGLFLTKDNDSLAHISTLRLQHNRLAQTWTTGIKRRLLSKAERLLTHTEKARLLPFHRLDESSFPPKVLAQFEEDEVQVAELLAQYGLGSEQIASPIKHDSKEKICTTG
jgi:hypothetical protein